MPLAKASKKLARVTKDKTPSPSEPPMKAPVAKNVVGASCLPDQVAKKWKIKKKSATAPSIPSPTTFASKLSSAKPPGKNVATKNGSSPLKIPSKPWVITELSITHHTLRVTMYHGTSMQGADCILRHGFQASRGGLLGKGAYLTTDKSKAGLYGPTVLTCSVDVGRTCRIDRRDHPHLHVWPGSCDTKFIPGDAVHQWTSQKGDVHCIRDMGCIAIIKVQTVRRCPCSIADCRQCFPDHVQQKAQRLCLNKGGKGKDQLSIVRLTTLPAAACCSQALPNDDSNSSSCGSEGGPWPVARGRDQGLASPHCIECGGDDTGVDATDPWELHWQACQIAEKAKSWSKGLAQEDVEGEVDDSSTTIGSGASDDER